MEQITVRSRPRVPAIDCGNGESSARLDRHLAVIGGPAVSEREAEGAAVLMQQLTSRDRARTERNRGAKLSLFAPLRRLRRTLFGGRG